MIVDDKRTGEPYPIEKDVPIPSVHKHNRGLAETMRRLEIGDSFVLTNKATTRAQVYHRAKLTGIKITTRAEDGNGRLRVWRVKGVNDKQQEKP